MSTVVVDMTSTTYYHTLNIGDVL